MSIKESFSKSLDLGQIKANIDRKKDSLYYRDVCTKILNQASETIDCPICSVRNNERRIVVKIYGLEYIQCVACRHVYIDHLPCWDEYFKLVDEASSYSSKLLYEDKPINPYRINNIAKPKVDFILEQSPERNRGLWCDIGCGTGEVLVSARKRGWDVVGVDNNESSRKFAKEVYELNVIQHAELNRELLGNVEMLTLFNVIEHVADPFKFLKEIIDFIPEQASVVIEVPRYDSFASIAQTCFPQYINRHLIPCFHFQLFSVESLNFLFDKLGLQIERRWWFGQDFYELLQLMADNNATLKQSALFKNFLETCNEFQEVIDQNRLSDGGLTILRKKRND